MWCGSQHCDANDGVQGDGGSQMVQCDDGMAGHRWCGWVGLQVVGCGSEWGPGWCWVDKSGCTTG